MAIVAIVAIVDGGLARVGSLALAYLRGTDGGSFAIYINVWYLSLIHI